MSSRHSLVVNVQFNTAWVAGYLARGSENWSLFKRRLLVHLYPVEQAHRVSLVVDRHDARLRYSCPYSVFAYDRTTLSKPNDGMAARAAELATHKGIREFMAQHARCIG